MRIVLAFLITTIFHICIQAEERVSPPIKEVTVFRHGAKITRGQAIEVPSGKSEIIFENLTPYFNANSLQVKIEGSAQLNGAVFQMRTPGPAPESPRVPIIRDSLVLLGDATVRLNNERTILQKEERLIETNLVKIGEKTKDGLQLSLEEVRDMTAFFRKEMMRIKERYLELDILKRGIDKQNQALNADLRKLQPNVGNRTGEIVLRIDSKRKQSIKVFCSYLISQTGWTPLYDIKSKDSDSPLDLIYKANVSNKSGFDWKNVKLTLSSAQPLANNERPKLAPLFIDFRAYAHTQSKRRKENGAVLDEVVVTSYNMKNMSTESVSTTGDMGQPIPPSVFEIESPSEFATVFEIKERQDILANGEENIVNVREDEIPAEYEFHTVPKLDQTVYLLAKVTNYGIYDLLPRTANIFFQDTYIGQSYLNPNTISDTLLISLGRDEQIQVKRCQPKDYTHKKKFLNNKIKEEFAYEITLKNNKRTEVTINLLDQIPISKQEDIDVELLKKDKAKHDKTYGKLEWNISLKPGQSKKVKFSYSIKYPKTKAVQISR